LPKNPHIVSLQVFCWPARFCRAVGTDHQKWQPAEQAGAESQALPHHGQPHCRLKQALPARAESTKETRLQPQREPGRTL